MQRIDGRSADMLRPYHFERGVNAHAEGSVLVSCGGTRVLCTASVENSVPGWLRGRGQGWVTAEYGMLPRATHERTHREAARGKQTGRTVEIQRLIGRALRAVVHMQGLGDRTIWLDCDVLQADGGTRCAAISGAFVAMAEAMIRLRANGAFPEVPLYDSVAAVSVGRFAGQPVLDLPYSEDQHAEVDMNVVATSSGKLVEVQGTAEAAPFTRVELDEMMDLAFAGCGSIARMQRAALPEIEWDGLHSMWHRPTKG